MDRQYFEYRLKRDAVGHRRELVRLGFSPFEVFRTARGMWAFWA